LGMIRLFIAAELPGAVRDVVGVSQIRLQHLDKRVRWVNPNGAHLTLKFLGDVEEHLAVDVVSRVRKAVCQESPVILQPGPFGAFPGPEQARVIWLGIEGQVEGLTRIYNVLESALVPMGFPKERRRFSPHVTVGRARRKPISVFLEQVAPIGAVHFKVDRVVVMSSDLGPGGADYRPLGYGMLAEATN